MSTTVTREKTEGLAEAIRRLDDYGDGYPFGAMHVVVGEIGWSTDDMLTNVAVRMAELTGRTLALGNVSKRDVCVILAAHGMDDTVRLEHYARAIARRVRGLRYEYGRMGGI